MPIVHASVNCMVWLCRITVHLVQNSKQSDKVSLYIWTYVKIFSFNYANRQEYFGDTGDQKSLKPAYT